MLRIFQLFIIYFIFSFNVIAKVPTLTVYTIKSIMSKEYGFAEELENKFQKTYGATLKFVVFNSSADLIMRLKLESTKTKADVILGLDYYHMEEAKDLDLFADHNIETSEFKFPVLWGEEQFLPYEYGYLGFLYKESAIKNPPKNFEDLMNSKEIKLVISNPYTSIPGFGLVLWLKEVYGSKSSKAWRRLKPKIVSITKSWTQAYTLFHKGEANMMLSYTNDALHLSKTSKDEFAMALFDEGQYLQSSLMGMLKSSKHPKLSSKLLETILQPDMQKIIAKKTWMYPIVTNEDIPSGYAKIETTRTIHPKVAAMNRRTWVKEWRSALSKSAS